MGLRLYNTLTRQIEAFEPAAPPRVTMYTCGPTVWNYAHIGNFRTFLFQDLLRRYLVYSGFDVFQVMNLTDVDDRIIAEAGKAGVTVAEHTIPFSDAFFADRDYLGIEPAEVYPRATESIDLMVELVETLLDRGLAYKADDGSVYFSVESFPSYGRLSQLDRRELRAGARVETDDYDKENVRDFALWKAATPEDEAAGAAWDARFGRGRPGWHLECSAMALGQLRSRFGAETLDIHAGGVDLVFPHHENEIAQSEGVTGKPFARFWLHGEFLTIEGTKMSKRYGNILTARDLQDEGIDPAALRMLLFQTHYRKQLNFSDENLEAAGRGAERLGELRRRLAAAADGAEGSETSGAPEPALGLERGFREGLDDDLNAPVAVAAAMTFVSQANRALDERQWDAGESRAALAVFDGVMSVLRLLPQDRREESGETAWIDERLAARKQARRDRDFDQADAIRDELAGRGIILEDTPGGTRWKKA